MSPLRKVHSLLAFTLALSAFAACNRTPEPAGASAEPTPAPKAAEPAAASASAEVTKELGSTAGTAPESASSAASAMPGSSAAITKSVVEVPRGHKKVLARPTASVTPSSDDPLGGKFTLDDATAGLPGKGTLVAEIRTDLGKLECELYADRAPITVANFVGLARGLRPFKNPKGEWQKSPAYDGTTFHRVVKGFMIQGGDPSGTGAGNPGYVIPDEIWEDAYHSERGLLCMANRGPNTNAMQFFVMDGSAPHLDNGYTIFGKCAPDSVVEKIASVEVDGDRARKPPKIQKISIRRR